MALGHRVFQSCPGGFAVTAITPERDWRADTLFCRPSQALRQYSRIGHGRNCDMQQRLDSWGMRRLVPPLQANLTYHVCPMPTKAVAAKASSLDSVFDELKAILMSHAVGLAERTGKVKNKRDYQLNSEKPVVIDGRKRDEMYFAGLIQQKDSVGFYFFPVYCCDELKARLSPELLKHLDGRACFHFKRLTPALKKDIQAALKIGLKAYRERKWI